MLDKYDHNLLLGYVEGELTPAEQARVEAMLAGDERLATLLRSMVADREALRTLTPEAVPGDLMEAVNLRLERQMLLDEPTPLEETVRTHKTFRLHRALIYSGLAAMVLISAGVVVQTLVPVPWFQPTTLPGMGGGATATGPVGPGDAMAMKDDRSGRDEVGRLDRRAAMQRSEDAADALPPMDTLAMKGGPARSDHAEGSMRLGKSAAEATSSRESGARSAIVDAPPPAAAPPAPAVAATPRPEEPAAIMDADTHPEAPVFFARLVPAENEAFDLNEALASTSQELRRGGLTQMAWRGAPRASTAQDAEPQVAPVALCVNTDDADHTQRDLLAWAVGNNVRVLPAGGMSYSAAREETQAFADKLEPGAEAETRNFANGQIDDHQIAAQRRQTAARRESEQVLVVVSGAQVPELVEYLNRSDRQFADVVPASDEGVTAATGFAGRAAESAPSASDAGQMPADQRRLLTPPIERARLALDLSNGWGELLLQQLPLSPRTAVFDDSDTMILPVRINVDPSPANDGPVIR
jgi:hypothetical protein